MPAMWTAADPGPAAAVSELPANAGSGTATSAGDVPARLPETAPTEAQQVAAQFWGAKVGYSLASKDQMRALVALPLLVFPGHALLAKELTADSLAKVGCSYSGCSRDSRVSGQRASHTLAL